MTPRVLVTVSRSFREWSAARVLLTRIREQHRDAVLLHGGCEDGDQQAAGIWRSLGGVDDPRPAKWSECGPDCPPWPHRKIRRRTGEEYCPGAGHRRNAEMVEEAPVLVLAL